MLNQNIDVQKFRIKNVSALIFYVFKHKKLGMRSGCTTKATHMVAVVPVPSARYS